MRQNYLRWGHPDGRQEVSIGIALPVAIVKDGWWSCLGAFAYITILGFVVPLWTGIWWYRFQSTTSEGLYASTAHRFLVASTHFGNMDSYKVAKLMLGCREVVEIVKQYQQKTNIEALVHLCGSQPTWKVYSASDQDTPVIP
jgi:preprotein translocase subunit Sec63